LVKPFFVRVDWADEIPGVFDPMACWRNLNIFAIGVFPSVNERHPFFLIISRQREPVSNP
jgi:hypothetical protein